MKREYLKRFILLMIGLVLYGFGLYLGIQANVGLAPWTAFDQGVSVRTGMLIGNVSVVTSGVIVLVDLLLKEKIGFGTVLNGVVVGKFIDLFMWLDWMPVIDNFIGGVLMLLAGQFIICIASYFYIGAGFGCGPRDSLMVALCRIFDKTPVGLIRALLEGTVLLIGWLLGGKVGIGTVISVFGIGILMQYTFRVLKFDVKAVKHETFSDTVRGLRGK